MNDYMHGKGQAVLLIGSMWMTMLGLAMGSTAFSATSPGGFIYSLLAAVVAIGLAAFTFQAALDLGGSNAASDGDASTMVPLRVPVRRRPLR